jgi:hypothetical protein
VCGEVSKEGRGSLDLVGKGQGRQKGMSLLLLRFRTEESREERRYLSYTSFMVWQEGESRQNVLALSGACVNISNIMCKNGRKRKAGVGLRAITRRKAKRVSRREDPGRVQAESRLEAYPVLVKYVG